MDTGTNLLRLPSPYIFFFASNFHRLSTQQRYTGGTIGMMKGPDGSLRPEPGELQRRLTKIEELNQAVDGQMFGGYDGGRVFNKILDLELECERECHDMWSLSWVDYWPPWFDAWGLFSSVLHGGIWSYPGFRRHVAGPLKTGKSDVAVCLKNPRWQ